MPKYKYCLIETIVTEYSVQAPDEVQAVSISERCGGSPTGRRKVVTREKSVGFPPMDFDETIESVRERLGLDVVVAPPRAN